MLRQTLYPHHILHRPSDFHASLRVQRSGNVRQPCRKTVCCPGSGAVSNDRLSAPETPLPITKILGRREFLIHRSRPALGLHRPRTAIPCAVRIVPLLIRTTQGCPLVEVRVQSRSFGQRYRRLFHHIEQIEHSVAEASPPTTQSNSAI